MRKNTLSPTSPAKRSRNVGESAPDPIVDHMARRQRSGLTLRAIADDFGLSKSSVHRKLQSHNAIAALRDGYTKSGKID